MSNVDMSRQEAWATMQEEHTRRRAHDNSTSGGDGPTSGGMEARVKSLEDKFDKIDGKLTTIGNDMAYLKGKLEGMPTGEAFGALKATVDGLPSVTKMATIIGIAVALVTIVTKWPEALALFG